MDNIQQILLSKLSSTMQAPIRLRDLIRQIRAARTAADERSVVQRECAYIRATFRQEDNVWRCRNVVKLLYIHMLGYPAHFGQLECLRLIASSRFTDKRIGYLGAMLLLDEKQEVHLLMTNCLKNDLKSTEQFIVGLALCTLGAICSPEMAGDLAGEVERLMRSSASYIKKKAILCAARMVKKAPEILDYFIPSTSSLLNERSHGVLIASVVLMTEMSEKSEEALMLYRKSVPQLVHLLKTLMMSGNSPDHDVGCVSDPFLQVKILRLLRILGKNNSQSSEEMIDLLASIATNTESSKNVGYAILYETVLTMMEIEVDSGVRELAINTLGRFLLNMDKNIRYVALETFLKTAHTDYSYVQRHRVTIVECLKDMDVSIQKKAMELSFFLINKTNFKSITKDLLHFLDRADTEFKAVCASNLCTCAEKFASDPKSQIDTMIKVLTTAGNYVRDDVVGNLCQLISGTSSLHSYCVRQLWVELKHDLHNKQPLVQVSMWCLGEFSNLINDKPLLETQSKILETTAISNITFDEFDIFSSSDLSFQLVKPQSPKSDFLDALDKPDVLDESDEDKDGEKEDDDEIKNNKLSSPASGESIVKKCQEIILDPQINIATKEYAMNALSKISVRFPDQSANVKMFIDGLTTDQDLELQQRSIEFSTMFSRYEELLPAVFEQMPPIEKPSQDEENGWL